jgi:nitrogen regulatory protein PII
MANNLHLITAIVQTKAGDATIDAALKAGATAATYFGAEGTGIRQRLGPVAKEIEASKRVLMIVTEPSQSDLVLNAIVKAARLDDPGQGFAWVQEVVKTVGYVAARR